MVAQRRCLAYGVAVRRTEFWERMEHALGVGYARSWAHDQVLTELGGRSVAQALDAGEDPKAIWRVVHRVLNLPSKQF